MYYPKHRFDLDNLYIVLTAFTPLLIKNCKRSKVISITVRGIS